MEQITKEQRFKKFCDEHKGFFTTPYEKRYIPHPKRRINIKKKDISRKKKIAFTSLSKWRKKYPDRNRAHKIVFVAVRNGSLKKESCFCGNSKSEAHHENYNKPLEVIWLCKKHHTEADKKRRLFDKSIIHSYGINVS